MNRSRWIRSLIAVLVLGAACSSDATGGDTQAGTLLLRLTTPHADDGAVMFEVSGAPIDSATTANASLRLFTRRVGGDTVVAVVVGTIADGGVVALKVPNVAAAARYAGRVLEVADRQNALRASLAGYALTVTP